MSINNETSEKLDPERRLNEGHAKTRDMTDLLQQLGLDRSSLT